MKLSDKEKLERILVCAWTMDGKMIVSMSAHVVAFLKCTSILGGVESIYLGELWQEEFPYAPCVFKM
jgi:hypothetical protein